MDQKQRVNIKDFLAANRLSKKTGITAGEIIEFGTSLGVRTLEIIFEDQEEVKKFKTMLARNNYYCRNN